MFLLEKSKPLHFQDRIHLGVGMVNWSHTSMLSLAWLKGEVAHRKALGLWASSGVNYLCEISSYLISGNSGVAFLDW